MLDKLPWASTNLKVVTPHSLLSWTTSSSEPISARQRSWCDTMRDNKWFWGLPNIMLCAWAVFGKLPLGSTNLKVITRHPKIRNQIAVGFYARLGQLSPSSYQLKGVGVMQRGTNLGSEAVKWFNGWMVKVAEATSGVYCAQSHHFTPKHPEPICPF